jgi:hypothetical protein
MITATVFMEVFMLNGCFGSLVFIWAHDKEERFV